MWERGRRRLGEGTATPSLVLLVMLDAEEWKIAVEIYKGHSTNALNLSFQLIAIKQSLERGSKGIPDAIEGLELAIASLYPHTNFHKLGQRLFRRKMEGALTTKEEDLISKLGVKI